ncbi:MAG TPA: hypothetical protein PLP01_15410 [Phycisphaerae bacterium]|nr:hypothetical protein [Phycisphaerae bacterium]
MDDNEELVELNRLVSGELSDDESLALQNRMLQDADLRAEYERLQEVDALVREAYLQHRADGAAPPGEGEASLRVPHDDRRLEHMDEIVGRIREAAILRGRRHTVRFPRLPWGIAAALFVAVGLSIWAGPRLLGPRGLDSRASVIPLSSDRVAHYAALREKLGENVAIIWRDNAGTYKPVSGQTQRPVVVRVTVVRTDAQEQTHWTADAVVPQGETIEMVTNDQTAWPASIRVSVAANGDTVVPVSLQAQLVRGESSDMHLTADVPATEAVSVGNLQVGAARYEIFVQAERMAPGRQAM